jgi:nitronate monooxygenase
MQIAEALASSQIRSHQPAGSVLNPFHSKLGIDSPIFQAPMAGVSTPEMAAAVSNAGGLGAIGIGSVDASAAREMIVAVRRQTPRPFNVNVFCHQPAVADKSRDAAWLARLEPEFARYGKRPPDQLDEIYQSFLTDDARWLRHHEPKC